MLLRQSHGKKARGICLSPNHPNYPAEYAELSAQLQPVGGVRSYLILGQVARILGPEGFVSS